MSEAAFIGSPDLVRAFEYLSVKTFGIKNKEELSPVFEGLIKEGCKIIFILEEIAKDASDVLERYKDKFASMVVIPDYRADLGISTRKMRNAIVEAVGADIL